MRDHFEQSLLSVSQVARILNISGQSVRNMCRSGKLSYTMVGSQFRISSDSVDAILAGCKFQAPIKRFKLPFQKAPNHIGN